MPDPRSEATSVLQEMRRKLLDLTARNRLLNFRHTASNCIRAIDEVPNQLFTLLMDGGSFTFEPVPEPTRPELLKYYAAKQGVAPGLVPPSELDPPKAEIWAEHRGIKVNHELPTEPQAAQHLDTKIQTLFYRDALEPRLRKLRGDARTAIEETGTNLLYLAIGFVEWRDPRNPTAEMLAPLILVPVELERTRLKGGKHVYALSWNGEDLQENLCLQKKLQDDFGLELPEFPESLALEAYFECVRRLISVHGDWTVRRYVTLSLFQFGKLLLYRDLDPTRWPNGTGPTDHSLVKKLLFGENGTGPAYATSEAVSADEIDLHLELIDRADSTQGAALSVALSGETIVV